MHPAVESIVAKITYLCEQISDTGWSWFASLTREEWIIVLGSFMVIGFIFMKGNGSRKDH